MKKTQIKTPKPITPIEINNEAHDELFGIVQYLKDKDENIPRIVRGLLLREYLPSYLMRNGAPESEVLDAIASQRRAIALTMLESDSIERRLTGGEVERAIVPKAVPRVEVADDSADDEAHVLPDNF